ncbi:unnamed protein product, partial [Didymodactylos carnosus]
MKTMIVILFWIMALLSIVLFLFIISLSNGDHPNPKRVLDNMYIEFDRVRYCVRRLNATHEIGCQSSLSGNTGIMHMIDQETDFTYFMNNFKSQNKYIIVLNAQLFDSSHIDRLIETNKLNGLLLYLKSNTTRPSSFSHDDQCPNNRNYTLYPDQQQQTCQWNANGTGLFFRHFSFPIMMIDEYDDYKRIVEVYHKFNDSNTQSPSCGLEMKTFMNAAHSSKTCMRRNQISHLLIDVEETYCDPVGGLNIYAKFLTYPVMKSTSDTQQISNPIKSRPPKSVILILAQTDGFQFFLKTKIPGQGADQPGSSLITFLSLAHIIGSNALLIAKLKEQERDILFLTLDGDSLDYSASYRIIFDMNNNLFPSTESKYEERIKLDHIHSIIEIQSIGLAGDNKLWIHTDPNAVINQTFINLLINNSNGSIDHLANVRLPPASSQIFLQQTNSTLPCYVLSDAKETYQNHYYHSIFDDIYNLKLNSTSYNQTTDFSLWIKQIVQPLAQSIIQLAVGDLPGNVSLINQQIINDLAYCILQNINCEMIHNLTVTSVGNTFSQFNLTSLPFSINTYPTSSTPTFTFIENVLAYFLRDRSFDRLNMTEDGCKNYTKDVTDMNQYTYVKGYRPSIENDVYTGYCVKSYLKYSQSLSPAFIIKNYDLSTLTYPAWTESRWALIQLRLFVIPTKKHEIATLIIGIILLCLSFIICALLRMSDYKRKKHSNHDGSSDDDENNGDRKQKNIREKSPLPLTSTIAKATPPSKPVCKYGRECYRNNPDHFRVFHHPTTDDLKSTEKLPTTTTKNATKNSHSSKEKKEETTIVKENTLDRYMATTETSNSFKEKATSDEQTTVNDDINTYLKLSNEKLLFALYEIHFPKDLYEFWKFCTDMNEESPRDALKSLLNFELVGPFEILDGYLRSSSTVPNLHLHYRYFYDVPEFMTVIKGDETTQFHIGYY